MYLALLSSYKRRILNFTTMKRPMMRRRPMTRPPMMRNSATANLLRAMKRKKYGTLR
jgi:hypothetical protein